LSVDFDVDALYAALDERRRARGLSWQGVAREVSRPFDTTPSRPIAASTLTGMRTRRAIEGDGVPQQLRWLNRTPESFVPGGAGAAAADCALPHVAPNKILRFDTRAIYAALDAQRRDRGLTWKQVAIDIGGFQPAALTRLANGGRTGFPDVMRIARWLGRPVASLTRITSR
jgi:hypothetical protein